MSATPGWYPEPSDPRASRFWDGQRWTDHVLPTATIGATSTWAAPTDRRALPLWAWLLIGGAALLVLTLLPPIVGLLSLIVLVTGIVALATSRPTWMRLPSRAVAVAATAASAVLLLAAGGLTATYALTPSADAGSAVAAVDTEVKQQTFAGELSTVADTSATDAQTALAVLATLEVKGRAPKTGYDRDEFGQRWLDVDRNGCDTRNDILARDLTEIVRSGSCTVSTGALADPFTGEEIAFERGQNTSARIQIDHVVALSDAWQKGAQELTADERASFANDPLNLLAVSGPANQQKGDSDAATWLPRNKKFRCAYVARQISVKATYALWVTQAEHDAMAQVLAACPDEPALSSDFAPKATTEEEVVTEPVAYQKTTVDDPNLLVGQQQVTTAGRDGERTLTYRVTVVEGQEKKRELVSDKVTKPPVAEVTSVGTGVKREAPAPPASNCDSNYAEACVPIAEDVDCAGGSGNGPAYLNEAARVVGSDVYGLDRDGDGWGCEPW